MNKHTFAVIMAGGKGERFWPESRDARPKQFLKLFSDKSMIEMTVARIAPAVSYDHIFIITNLVYVDTIRDLLPQIPAKNIIGEPARRDTAPCVALAAGLIQAEDPQGIMILLPSDHMIVNHEAFRKDIEFAVDNADDDLCTLGITPTFPCTDYGYIESAGNEKINIVKRFVEKPERARAENMLATGNFFWNSGMFIWKNSTIIKAFEEHAPAFSEFIKKSAEKFFQEDFSDFLDQEFPKLPKISIDYAIMEKSSNIKVIRAGFDWDDVGNWNALRKYLRNDTCGNVSKGNVKLLDSENNIIFSNNKDILIAGIDLKDMLIVNSDDVVLIAPNSSAAKLKNLLKEISSAENMQKYL